MLLPLLLSCAHHAPVDTLTYPQASRGDVVDNYHGTEVSDPYRWLEDPTSPQTLEWIRAQNALTTDYFAQLTERDAIRDRLNVLWRYESYSAPYDANGRLFFARRGIDDEQASLYVQDSPEAEARLLLDPKTFSEDNTVSLAGWRPTRDGRLLAYATSDGGSDWRVWRVRDVETGEDLEDTLRWIKFSTVRWTPEGDGLYYARYPRTDNPLEQQLLDQKLYFHKLGTPQDEDVLVYENPQEPEWGFGTWADEDMSTLLLLTSRSTEEVNLVHRLDPNDFSAPPQPLYPDWDAGRWPVTVEGDDLYLLTNAGAPNYRLIRRNLSDLDAPEVDVIPERKERLQSVRRVGDRLFAVYLQDAKTQVETLSLSGEPLGAVALPGVGTVYGFGGDRDDTETYYTFTNFITPPTIYRYDLETGESVVFRRPELDFNPDNFIVEQLFYTSRDGTRVPMFVAHHKDVTPNGDAPTLLYGYGGFNVSVRPSFSSSNLVWMEMGGVYVSANLRGGGEYGQSWHLAGTRTNKQNVFDDFIAAAEHLIAAGWTQPERLAIHGRSNGGLLVGATLLQRPDLFGAALPAVGVLDMLRYHHFTIGRAWASDYGTAEDPEEFAALYAYSPLHNVTPGEKYPATLITTADRDDRVVPAHSYKFAAALQAGQGGPEPVLIRIDTRAGHGAGRSLTQIIEERADMWAFLANELEMELRSFTADAAPNTSE